MMAARIKIPTSACLLYFLNNWELRFLREKGSRQKLEAGI